MSFYGSVYYQLIDTFYKVVIQNKGDKTFTFNPNPINPSDTPSEEIFVQDETEKKVWRLGKGNLLVTHGFGYSRYEQNKLDIKQKLEV